MKKIIPLLLILSSCSAFPWKVAEDVVEGELEIAEKVSQDLK